MKNLSTLFLCLLALIYCQSLQAQNSFDPEAKLSEMGISLVPPSPSTSNILKSVRTGNLVFLSGHGPTNAEGETTRGKLGVDLDVEQGREAAKLTGIQLLSSLKAEIGDLKKVKKIVKVLGMVNSAPDFVQQPAVVHGFTDFMVEVFGEERGKHARSAVGMASLPGGMAIEIEMIVEIED
ncbi:RidA family protein [Pleomorphovibrio marinus]|uniref:RidA family protein n=1 Tax=Pleomorphovibrio marinus TaxID=2164132 RepID=UPI000E0A0EEB|nr:RidA family protein [Pleomorphovibrio marinus]